MFAVTVSKHVSRSLLAGSIPQRFVVGIDWTVRPSGLRSGMGEDRPCSVGGGVLRPVGCEPRAQGRRTILNQRGIERPFRTRRGFLAGLLGVAPLVLLTAGCDSGGSGDGEYGQQFEKPKDAAAGAAGTSAPTQSRADMIKEDQEKPKNKAKAKGR